MPFPIILLALGGLAVAALAAKPKKPKLASFKFKKPTFKLKSTEKIKLNGYNKLLQTFGMATATEYPAPYRLQDAKIIAEELIVAISTGTPHGKPFQWRHNLINKIKHNFNEIDNASLPNWQKVYAIIMTVMVPAFASGLLFYWYEPRTRVREDKFTAMIMWAAMFLASPETSTAFHTISDSFTGGNLTSLGKSFPPSAEAYRKADLNLRRGDLSPAEMRVALYDLFHHIQFWRMNNLGGWDNLSQQQRDLINSGNTRINDIKQTYPLTAESILNTERVVQGNFKTVDEIVWMSTAVVQSDARFSFDEAAAWLNLVVQIVGVVISAVAPLVSPAIGSIMQTAANAVQGISRAIASGKMSSTQIQGVIGSGITYMLEDAAIYLGLDDELKFVESAVESVV